MQRRILLETHTSIWGITEINIVKEKTSADAQWTTIKLVQQDGDIEVIHEITAYHPEGQVPEITVKDHAGCV